MDTAAQAASHQKLKLLMRCSAAPAASVRTGSCGLAPYCCTVPACHTACDPVKTPSGAELPCQNPPLKVLELLIVGLEWDLIIPSTPHARRRHQSCASMGDLHEYLVA
jgi:hypothetical protein